MGAVLGCSRSMHVRVQGQGGRGFKATLDRVSSVEWGRVLDGTSEAKVVVPVRGSSCCSVLGGVRPWSHEIALVRDGITVWEGPVISVTDSHLSSQVTISARDLTAWFSKRRVHNGYDYTNTPTDLSDIARQAIVDGLSEQDPGVLEFLKVFPSGVLGQRQVLPNTVLVSDEISDMTSAGLNYTAVGRSILLFSHLVPLVQIPGLSWKDFTGDLPLEWQGLSSVNNAVTVGEGVAGFFQTPGGPYGLLESITKVDGVLDTSSANSAAQIVVDTNFPPPLVITGGSLGQLSPRAPVTMADLVPGVQSMLSVRGNCSSVTQNMTLEQVSVTWENNNETVSPTFAPITGVS
jgi:hypothetical protein